MERLERPIDPLDCIIIIGAAIFVALSSEGECRLIPVIFYFLIYNTESYKKGEEEIKELKAKVYKLREQAMV